MKEVSDMVGSERGSIITVWALIVALAALGFSVVAFNRSGRDVGEIIQEETVKTVQTAEQVAALARAEARLAALQTELAAERGYEEAAQEIAGVRADLEQAYQNASAEVVQEWRELDMQLVQLEGQVREQSTDALLTLEELLTTLRQDVKSEER